MLPAFWRKTNGRRGFMAALVGPVVFLGLWILWMGRSGEGAGWAEAMSEEARRAVSNNWCGFI